jgi:hypothetical protein
VTRFTRCVAVLVLALWGLAREHCTLEQVPGLEFLACCQHADKAPHQDNDCDEDDCAVVESGLYQMDDLPDLTPAAAWSIVFIAADWATENPLHSYSSAPLLSPAPPGLPQSWQFDHRAALPPRAPSVAA